MSRARIEARAGRLRCAIYTRKSSEEGLEQAFNSLHAQREACEAYVLSQAGEGWAALPTVYDDGGFSGGNIDRPALKRLLSDIAAGLVDVIVVYKVDRLTRSLADFAKIVEIFDDNGVSFVSVTQAFNTTSSMGRLTLNVLLSFAQFEREVTGERIRDKIAASKARGIWMGGMVPLGYDVEERALVVNEDEAGRVRAIFRRYLELGSVPALRAELDRRGERSKAWISRRGRSMGGASFSCGALFHILRSRVYRGEIVHKGEVHAGLHPAVVDEELFSAVQARLEENRHIHHKRPRRAAKSPLTNMIFDAEGVLMSPSFATGHGKKLYRYYVSAAVLPSRAHPGAASNAVRRVPAQVVEEMVLDRLRRVVDQPVTWDAAKPRIHRVQINSTNIEITFADDVAVPLSSVRQRLASDDEVSIQDAEGRSRIRISIPIRPVFRGGKTSFSTPSGMTKTRRPNPLLVRGLRNAHTALKALNASPLAATEIMATAVAPTDFYTRKTLPLAFLAPDIQKAILEGRQPAGLTMQELLDGGIPAAWEDQRRMFGFAS